MTESICYPMSAPTDGEDDTSARPWTVDDPQFFMPELAELAGQKDGFIAGQTLSRHILATGETGSGKTLSLVLPVLRGLLRYPEPGTPVRPEDRQCATLIIDPKHELLGEVRSTVTDPNRVVLATSASYPRLDFFEDVRGRGMTTREKLERIFEQLTPGTASTVERGGDNFYWNSGAKEFAFSLAELVASVESVGLLLTDVLQRSDLWGEAPRRDIDGLWPRIFCHVISAGDVEWAPEPDEIYADYLTRIRALLKAISKDDRMPRRCAVRFLRLVRQRQRKQRGAKTFYATIAGNLAHESSEWIWHAVWRHHRGSAPMRSMAGAMLAQALTRCRVTDSENWFGQIEAIVGVALRCIDPAPNATRDNQHPFRELGEALGRLAKEMNRHDLVRKLAWMISVDGKTAYWMCDIAQKMLAPLASTELSGRLCLNPVDSASAALLNVTEVVESGGVIVFQPGLTMSEADLAYGRTLKRLFFSATFRRKNKQRAVAYVCDEFQRFITGDPDSGEQAFLDRCRAYRAICVLATQSIASLQYELLTRDRQTPMPALQTALAVMMNNIGNKFFFRNTDPNTIDFLRQQIPAPPGAGPHVITVRPLSTLQPGEPYFLLANGCWGRRQVVFPLVALRAA